MSEQELSLHEVVRIAFLSEPHPPIHPETDPERMLKAGLSQEAGALAVAHYIRSHYIPDRF